MIENEKTYYIKLYKYQLQQYEAFKEYYNKLKNIGNDRQAYKVSEIINDKKELMIDILVYISNIDLN